MRAPLALMMLALPGTALAQSAADDGDRTPVPAIAPHQDAGPIDAVALGFDMPGADALAFAPSIAASQAPSLFAGAPVSEGELAATHGREQVNWLEAVTSNTAVVTNNKVGNNSTTGNVNVSDFAFQNVSGIAMVNFNTGNNSSINAGMSINLQINYAHVGQ